jgi:hypothetical protein
LITRRPAIYLQAAWFILLDSPKNTVAFAVRGLDWSLPLFNRDLQQGMTGYDVYLLQKVL